MDSIEGKSGFWLSRNLSAAEASFARIAEIEGGREFRWCDEVLDFNNVLLLYNKLKKNRTGYLAQVGEK